MKLQSTIILIVLCVGNLFAQDMASYTAGWEGTIPDSKTFDLTLEIQGLQTQSPKLKIFNDGEIMTVPIQWINGKNVESHISERIFFEGMLSKDGTEINGFMKSGMLLYHITLTKSKDKTFKGIWNILMVDELMSDSFYLSVENGSDDDYQAYPILGDDRFTGTWCGNFRKQNDSIFFSDFKTGMEFKGKLFPESIALGIYLGNNLITQIDLKRSQSKWKIGGFPSKDDSDSQLQLAEMESLILSDSLEGTHSVLVSKRGKLIYEKYFHGYNANISHDMRSASKSISSCIAGLAKDNKLFRTVDKSVFEFMPEEYQAYRDSAKSQIDLKSLLTMSSGLDAVDFGIERNSSGSEDNYQQSSDWVGTILAAPMINPPNIHALYGSANPYLLGVALDSIVSGPLEFYMDQNLFQPLGITNYIIQTDLTGRPYFGGGMYMAPRDMLKFGQLYLNLGKWKGKQVISKEWVGQTFTNYRQLENTNQKNGYGYLWWFGQYEVGGKTIKSVEARGAGGQYIFVVPEKELVVVITSGNYRNGKTQQPEKILTSYILPQFPN